MKREPFMIFFIGMCLGCISQACWNWLGVVMGVLGYFITICVVLGMTFNDKSDE